MPGIKATLAALGQSTTPSAVTAPTSDAAAAAAAPAPGMFDEQRRNTGWVWDEAANGWRNGDEILGPEFVSNGVRMFAPEIRDEDGRVEPRPFGGATPEYMQQVWDMTPGNGAAKLAAVSRAGAGYPSAIQWLQQAGIPLTQADIDAIMGSGEMIATQQHFQSKASQGPFGGAFKDVLNLAGMLDVSGMTNMFTAPGSEDLGLADYIANPAAAIWPETAEVSRGLVRMSSPAAPIMTHTGQAIRYGAPFDPKTMVQNSALSAGVGLGIQAIAPYIGALFEDVFGDTGLAIDPADAEEIRRAALEGVDGGQGVDLEMGGMPPAIGEFDPSFDGAGMLPVADGASGSFDPAEYDWQADPSLDTTFATRMADAALGVPLDEADAANRAELEAGDAPAASTISPETVQKYAKLAKTVYEMLGSEGEGAPTQGEGETPEQYSGELADYLGLSAQEMADAGLQPGSTEYYEYIMERADFVIQNVLDGVDVDAEDLAAQLRGKTDVELQQLQRALYVRGQLDTLMGSGSYTDPSTGETEEVIGTGGMFNPAVGAYQRGLARNVTDLSGMRGRDAYDYLNAWLGGDVDFFGMQNAADARMDLAKRTESDELRRRGMFGGGY